MKKNILTLALMMALPLTGIAEDSFYTADPSKADTGIILVPLAQMNPTKEDLSSLKQQKLKGYSIKESNDPREFIKESNRYPDEINDTSDPTDTHLKSDLSKIKLAFKFKPPSFLKPLGFAVGGTYIEDNGWTAISTFFNDKTLGSCKFKLNNMKISHGAVRIPKETVRYDVNKKITNVFVEGSNNSGFIYNIDWNDEINNYFLTCANMIYDKDITQHMIVLANKIDKSIQ